MRRGRPGALPRGTAGPTLTSVGTGEDADGPDDTERVERSGAARAAPRGERREVSRLWHVTLSVSGAEAPLAEVRRALEQLAHDHPFLLTSRYAHDHAEIRYWEEARDLHDAAAVALRLWGEHRSTARLPPWEIVGLEVIDRATYHQRLAEGYGPPPASPVGVHPY
ncbi:hypothetical protein ACWIG3_25740 [Streptomyces celluloflavus]|uniref:Uncharacterized protein n=2 Tax=Streptomyces TaxID=1883 RepID=A0A4Q9HZ69_STRKA|nr:hypothetical protein [Streptomyces kasugaensis]MYU55223.1 hypothetical protein [Streptomyces sp. SID7805]TBO60603.1 hypothetical protein EYS09_05805 [Streptomyces kasugaensis]WSK12395.1 hypothetical protein OG717_11745 [Streptomyces celluloflavus]